MATTPASTSSPGKTLFLHWGPGGNCAIERAWFEDGLGIHWWDQPDFPEGAADAYPRLIDAAALELERLSGPRNEGVRVLAHSFGGQIALALADRMPGRISELTFLGSSESTPRAFQRLAQALGARGAADGEITRLANAPGEPEGAALWELIDRLGKLPGLLAHYWAATSEAPMKRYFELAAKFSPLNFTSFGAVLSSYLSTPRPKGPIRFEKPVRFVFGSEDPLVRTDEEFAAWRRWFPDARADVISAGHFIHFEAPSEAWLSARA